MSKSIRRSFALAGAAALASSMVLAGAQGAVAAGTTGSPSAAAAPQADKAAHRALDLSVAGVPSTFIAGGEPKQFTFKVDNATKHDFVFYPFLKFKNREGSLEADHLKVEYQLPGGSWLPATVAPGGGDTDDDAVLIMLGGVDGDGNADGGALLAVNRGKSLNINVRASFTNDAPLGKAGVVPVVFSAELDDKSGEAVDNGHFSCDGIKGAGFTIKAGGSGKPSPTAKPTTAKPTTGKPSPTATKPTGSPTTSQSPTATPTATTSPSATATATPTATTTATPSATATPSTTASPSATTSPTTAPTETAKPTGPTTSAPATSPAATAPVDTTSAGPQEPIDFPVSVPNVTPPKLTPAAVSGAKTAADKALATTGGGDNTTAIAIAGGAVLAAGAGTLLVLRRRKSAQQG
ncbi:LPXTG cell wall anchor domain-containing protein [Kitasatospora sp. CM 4170]|uniref:LPXTG cell wall anchor domain-containing protein n=1 Tax=Kitasatospora aburaviensis TaxID=67265 RepID=A0ABW1EXF1_9ACTN|nr:LPXTG cell wall anchor domain-containing protein [Kitasatospora sp. CM 4170]WNM46728.1 LPXTG cell wall anchor domain-containing protein [Kitasatospora sp. CM 4170]